METPNSNLILTLKKNIIKPKNVRSFGKKDVALMVLVASFFTISMSHAKKNY